MNIPAAKVIKLKLYVSVPGWPEKTCPKKPRREKRTGNLGRARHILRAPPGLYILNKLLKITKPAKTNLIAIKQSPTNTGKNIMKMINIYTNIIDTKLRVP